MSKVKHLLRWLDHMTSTDTNLYPGDGASITFYTTRKDS